jgi:hypothetical protein
MPNTAGRACVIQGGSSAAGFADETSIGISGR